MPHLTYSKFSKQCWDGHGYWCAACLDYILPDLEEYEFHHVIPKWLGRSYRVLRPSAEPLKIGRTIILHKNCHQRIQKQYDAALATFLDSIQRPQIERQILLRSEALGYFELPAAFRRNHYRRSRNTPEQLSELSTLSFALGGDIQTTKYELDVTAQDIGHVLKHIGPYPDSAVLQSFLTLAGPAINSGNKKLSKRILKFASSRDFSPDVKVQSTLARRNAMFYGDIQEARRAMDLADAAGWSRQTAEEQMFSALVTPHHLGKVLDLEGKYCEKRIYDANRMSIDIFLRVLQVNTLANHLFEDDISSNEITSEVQSTSIFHYANRLLVLGSLQMLRRESQIRWQEKTLKYLYGSQFLQVIFGLQLLPIWNPLLENDRRNIHPDQLLSALLSSGSISRSECLEARRAFIGKNALRSATQLIATIFA